VFFSLSDTYRRISSVSNQFAPSFLSIFSVCFTLRHGQEFSTVSPIISLHLTEKNGLFLTIYVSFTLRHRQEGLHCVSSHFTPSYCLSFSNCLCFVSLSDMDRRVSTVSLIISLHLNVCLFLTVSVCFTLSHEQEGLHCVSNHFTPSFCLSFSNCLCFSFSDTDRRVSIVSPIISLHLTVCLFLTVSVIFIQTYCTVYTSLSYSTSYFCRTTSR
jgi:hypothetical protein